jgi:hypothetical protein
MCSRGTSAAIVRWFRRDSLIAQSTSRLQRCRNDSHRRISHIEISEPSPKPSSPAQSSAPEGPPLVKIASQPREDALSDSLLCEARAARDSKDTRDQKPTPKTTASPTDVSPLPRLSSLKRMGMSISPKNIASFATWTSPLLNSGVNPQVAEPMSNATRLPTE